MDLTLPEQQEATASSIATARQAPDHIADEPTVANQGRSDKGKAVDREPPTAESPNGNTSTSTKPARGTKRNIEGTNDNRPAEL
ncbi:hypothetical protein CYLTODRAFT_247363 [Cylindrobasidium torrendii FP15055 ss-10]|uniref:Uncharacterized protein n=1 Tax=Cylindrobasidium torrendii FP15055 ss-10 TaxID=1314674 RepID=A0A0D7BFG4_9AGAR|nr:hypothetical protein CYLTODRAFT_247363 [Cylindrobasidium torrendii FP15055 ss-10]